MIVNFWLILAPSAETAVAGVAQVAAPSSAGHPEPAPVSVSSVQYLLLNSVKPETLKMFRNFPERSSGLLPQGIWNCYARGDGLHVFVPMREDLQRLAAAYAPDIVVGGCWNVATGEPIGGVGSPWFDTPPELSDRRDIVLMAGQAPRRFI